MAARLGSSNLNSTWILVTLGASIITLIDGGWLAYWAALMPERIWHGQIWRVFTWAFVELGPVSVMATCVTIYKFGGDLAPRWGDRRLRRFIMQIVIACGVVTAVAGCFSQQSMYMFRCGGWALGDALVISWARQFPHRQLRLFGGLLQLGGQQLVALTVGVTVLFAIGSSPFVMAPEIVACLAAALYPRSWLTR
jgi:membrane associated rhomboid family serine protease